MNLIRPIKFFFMDLKKLNIFKLKKKKDSMKKKNLNIGNFEVRVSDSIEQVGKKYKKKKE